MSGRWVLVVGGEPSFQPQVARALYTSPDSVAWIPTIGSAERSLANAPNRVELLVLAPDVSDDEAMRVAGRLSKDSPSTAVVLVREEPVDGAFPRLVRSGIRDVVDLSDGTQQLEDSLRSALDWSAGVRAATPVADDGGPRGSVVSVFSTKGGTGKTFLATNLAAAMADRSSGPVALLDLDHDLGDVFAYFNAEPRRSLQDLVSLEEGADPESVLQLGTPLEGGVVGFGSTPDPRAEPIASAAMVRVLHALTEAFPFVVVDASAEYSDHVLAAFDASDVVCLVTALDVIGVRHLSLGLQTLESLGIPRDRFRVVLNRADSKVDLSSNEIERILGIQVDARIPSSPLVPRSVNHGRLLWFEEPKSDVAKSIGALADALCRQLAPQLSAPAAARRRFRRS
jgi:pilus assembly protein CpaE